MRTNNGMCLAAILFILSASPVAAQSPAGAQDDGGQTGAGESLLIDRIDPERLRLIGNERTRQYILGAGMMAVGRVVGSRSRTGPSTRASSALRSPASGWRRSSSR